MGLPKHASSSDELLLAPARGSADREWECGEYDQAVVRGSFTSIRYEMDARACVCDALLTRGVSEPRVGGNRGPAPIEATGTHGSLPATAAETGCLKVTTGYGSHPFSARGLRSCTVSE